MEIFFRSFLSESLVFFTWCTVLVYVIVEYRYKTKVFGAFVMPVAFLALAFINVTGMSSDITPLVPALKSNQAAFELRNVKAVTVPGGTSVRIVYRRNSAPDPVTGRQYRDEVERYEIVAGGREVVMELFGPVGADNVDAYKTMIDSLKLT